jgi:aerobic-type carbon monoxide dehydrogenase small subunit (CoxS/CutS family)
MATFTLKVNNKSYTVEADPKMPLLWAIRDLVGSPAQNTAVA